MSDAESTVDIQESADITADLQNENIANSEGSGANDASTTDLITTDDLQRAPLPKQRVVGFFAFAACALVAIYFMSQRHIQSSDPKAEAIFAATFPGHEVQSRRTEAGRMLVGSGEMQKAAVTDASQGTEGKRKSVGTRTSAALGVVTFESRSFATSEKAVAAVFIVKRTQVVRGKALVRWAVHSGSADAGIDFSDASGIARFSDGQRQLAIYVPLRNDLLKEADETFKVCLRSPRQTRIGGKSCAEATIRDDDDASQI